MCMFDMIHSQTNMYCQLVNMDVGNVGFKKETVTLQVSHEEGGSSIIWVFCDGIVYKETVPLAPREQFPCKQTQIQWNFLWITEL